jgi:hypothetical protein
MRRLATLTAFVFIASAPLSGDDQAAARFFDSSVGSSFVELAYHEHKQR